MFKIELLLGTVSQWAQNPSTASNCSLTTVWQGGALTFPTVADAHRWLARHGFMRRTRARWSKTGFRALADFPSPFTGFTIHDA